MTTIILSHPGKKDQRCTVQRKKEGEKKKKKSYRSPKAHKVQVDTTIIDMVEPKNAAQSGQI